MNRDNYSHLNSSYISQETYYRLDLPSLLPNIEKIIYIDCDVVIDGDLSTLYNIEMENNLTWAVSETTMVNYYQDIYHLNTSNGFFNAWVLLLNLKLRRKNPKKWEDILNFLNSNNTKLMACDQDWLNAVFHDTYIKLAPKYNALPALFAGSSASNLWYNKSEYIDAKKHPIVIHFAGEKPWKYFCSHPMKNKYVFYRKQIKSDNSDYIKNWFSIVWLVNHYMYSLQTWLMANLDTKQYRKYIYIPKKIITQRLSK
jgi:lipopolysaccharide biosynthesis glycosyltransferase